MATIIRESIRFATTGTRLAMPVMTASRIPIALGTRAFVPPLSVSLFHKNKGSIRPFATETEKEKPESGNSSGLFRLALIAAVTGIVGTLYIFSQDGKATEVAVKKPLNYQEVYNAIANLLESNPEYDDGSYGPVLLRLAWHAAGTYDKATNTGGSNGATMRFNPESHHAANSGLATARDLLEKVKKQYPDITYSDLWSLGGVVAVQEMGGPIIKWRPGRADAVGEQSCSPDGRLPDGAQGQDHLRNVFYRMGFNDQEIVALAGAHALGRCHTDRSGFEGPWTRSPTVFTNDYFKRLLEEKWVEKKWTGPKQFVDKATSQLMMLPADMSLTRDKAFKKYVDLYASDEKKFFDDFASAFQKLEELGVPFKVDTPTMTFKPTA